MTADLAARLRVAADYEGDYEMGGVADLFREAAEEIEKLTKQRDDLAEEFDHHMRDTHKTLSHFGLWPQ